MWLAHTAVALAIASGCTGGSQLTPATSQSSGADVTEASRPALAVAVSAEPTTLGPAGRLTVKVAITNTGKTAATLSFSSGCHTDYELLDASGAVVGESFQMCTQAMTQRTLAPGASFTDTHVWIRGMAGQPKLAAGSVVRVRGVLLTQGAQVRSPNTVTVTLQ
jgi:hypothetical protein